MNRTLPALILRLLASRVVLAGLQFFTACAERLAPAAQPDLAALDADERAMFDVCHVAVVGTARTYCNKVMAPDWGAVVAGESGSVCGVDYTTNPTYADCPDCLRAYRGEGRPS